MKRTNCEIVRSVLDLLTLSVLNESHTHTHTHTTHSINELCKKPQLPDPSHPPPEAWTAYPQGTCWENFSLFARSLSRKMEWNFNRLSSWSFDFFPLVFFSFSKPFQSSRIFQSAASCLQLGGKFGLAQRLLGRSKKLVHSLPVVPRVREWVPCAWVSHSGRLAHIAFLLASARQLGTMDQLVGHVKS